MDTPGAEIVGREAELAEVERFLRDAAERPALLLIEGPAGMGKTTLWEAARAAAAGDGRLVLACRAAESERPLTYAGLADLLEAVPDAVLADLPEVQREALEIALLRRRPPRGGLEARAVLAGLLSLLAQLAAGRPLLIAVDDLQWVDGSTLRALDFTLRRLTAGPVGFVATVRRGELPLEVPSVAADARLRRLHLGGLAMGPLHHMLRERLGAPIVRPVMRQLLSRSGGNPLHALQLAAAGDLRSPAADVPGDLLTLLEARLAAHPPGLREVLLIAALAHRPTGELLCRAASDRRGAERDVALAVAERLLVPGADGLEFAHPLFAEAARALASDQERRRIHRRLAPLAGEPEERVVHRALAATAPSTRVASELEAAAHGAERRGAPDSAVRLLELAIGLTPAVDRSAAWRRRQEAARLRHKAGDAPAAGEELQRLVLEMPPGPERAQASMLLAEILLWTKGPKAALPHARRALEESAEERLLRAEAHLLLFRLHWLDDFEVGAADIHAGEAIRLLEPEGPPALLARALAEQLISDRIHGRAPDPAVLDRVLRLEREAAAASPFGAAPFYEANGATVLLLAGDFDRARELLRERLAAATAQGDEGSLATIHCLLAFTELRSGRWPEAGPHVQAALEAAEQSGQVDMVPQILEAECLLRGGLGETESAAAAGEKGARLALELDNRGDAMANLEALALLELSRERPEAAAALLDRAAAIAGEAGRRRVWGYEADRCEALTWAGRLDQARQAAAELKVLLAHGSFRDRRAQLLRVEGILAAADRSPDQALRLLEQALEAAAASGMPFELARTLLALGQVERRAKRWGAARQHLGQAARTFEALPAPLWARRARQELERVGGRPSASQDLTETERRVAELAAAGQTTAEIAGRLYLAPPTVSANLTRIYQKLGVRSRSELAAQLARTRAPD